VILELGERVDVGEREPAPLVVRLGARGRRPNRAAQMRPARPVESTTVAVVAPRRGFLGVDLRLSRST
jgi:hypothetical protein